MRVSILKSARFYSCLGLALLFNMMLVNAQQKHSNVTGEVVDENSVALPFVQATVKNSKDSSTVKVVLADDKGHFAFEIPNGKYFIELKMMGYATGYSKVFDIADAQSESLGTIQIKSAATQLADVNISAALPFVERRADKLIVISMGWAQGRR